MLRPYNLQPTTYNLLAITLILALLLFCLPPFWLVSPRQAEAATEDAWFNTSYKYRMKLTLDNTLVSGSTDLTNFPVLVAFTNANLATTGNGGDVTNSSGYDIIFAEADSTPAKLDHEIEKYTSTSGEIVMWVEIPTLGATADTDIYMYYGNSSVSSSQEAATGVWDSNFKGVWHLKEDPTGTAPQMKDSTSGANHGTSVGSMVAGDQLAGQIDGSLNFDGSNDYVDVANESNLDFERTDSFTLSAWIKRDTENTEDDIFEKVEGAGYKGYSLWLQPSANCTGCLTTSISNNSSGGTNGIRVRTAASTILTGTWYHVATTYSGTSAASGVTTYVNGASKTLTTAADTLSATILNDTKMGLGVDPTDVTCCNFDGKMDEMRISNSVRSADWVKTEYDNMANQGTGAGKFIKTLGSEQAYITSTGSSDTSWVKGGATGSNIALTVNNSSNSATTIQWVKVTRPSSNYTMTAGSATGWSAAVTSADVTFTGGSIAANASTAFTVTGTIGSSDEAQAAWTIDVDDATDGSTSTTTVASSSGALNTGIDATAPTVTMSGVTVDSTSQLTATTNTATDASSGLHSSAPYWFDETSGGGGATDSTDWQSAVTFVDTGLSAGTQYCYRVKARDAVLNESSYTSTTCATTTAAPAPAPAAAPAAQGSTAAIPPLAFFSVTADPGQEDTLITLTTNRSATMRVEYGLTKAYGSTTPEDANSGQKLQTMIKDLAHETTYHFRVKATDSGGSVVTSDDGMFTTPKAPPPPKGTETPEQEAVRQTEEAAAQKRSEEKERKAKEPPPAITDVSIVAVRPTSAKIAWKTGIPATSQVFFGEKSQELNQITIEYATLVSAHTVTISDLKPKTTYYFTAVSRNENGVEAQAPEASFTTESLEIQTVVDIAKPVALSPGSPGTQNQKTAVGETATVIPILPTAGDLAPPEVVLFPFAKNPTQDASPLIRGRARDARGVIAAVAYSTDSGGTWHPVDEIQGIGSSAAQFSATIPHLQEGEYGIVFRARDNSGNMGKSEAKALVIDIKPPKTGANTFALGSQTTTTSAEGTLTTLAGITQRILISAVGGATAVRVNAGDASFPLMYSKADNLWFGDITMQKPGVYRLTVEASDGAGRVSARAINTIDVVRPGIVIDTVDKKPIAAARVSLFSFSPELNDFVLWPGDIFNQANPTVTGEDGTYRFIAPAGRYFIKVEKGGYKTLYTQIQDFPNHSALNFTMPLHHKNTVSVRVPFSGAVDIPLPAVPDFFGYKRVSSSQEITREDKGKGDGGRGFPSLIGTTAPSFSLSDSAGNPVDIRYLRGRKTILTAWATWSPMAQIQIPILDRIAREDRKNINVLLFSIQEAKGVVETYLRRGNYDVQSVIDPDGDLLDLYPITTLPQHFFLDRKGIIQKVYTGFLDTEALEKMLSEIP